jgi:flagellar hook-associated protein 3 FlgL
MSDRVTGAMLTESTVADINSALATLQRTSSELSSGKKILEPSDDPFGASRVIDLQSQLDGLTSYSASVQDGISWENTAAGAMSSMHSILERVRELLVQANNGTFSQGDREAISTEVTQLTEALKQDANTQYGGQYVFSGTDTTTAPYAQGEDDTYAGNEGTVARAIAPGASVSVSTNLAGLLGDGQSSGDGKLLDTLRTIAEHLASGSPEALKQLASGDLGKLEAGIEGLSNLQAGTGSVTDQLQSAATRIEGLHESITAALSSTDSVNVAEATIAYSNEQAAYDAALRAGAKIVQESLLNFLS